MQGVRSSAAVWQPDLMCHVRHLSYDFVTGQGRVDMPEHNCVDMCGCIALFEHIDADCWLIETVAGDKPDTLYERTAEGWEAISNRGERMGAFVQPGESKKLVRQRRAKLRRLRQALPMFAEPSSPES